MKKSIILIQNLVNRFWDILSLALSLLINQNIKLDKYRWIFSLFVWSPFLIAYLFGVTSIVFLYNVFIAFFTWTPSTTAAFPVYFTLWCVIKLSIFL